MNESQENIIRWLHLSDFHVGKDDYGNLILFKEILAHVRQRKEEGFVPDLIFITGDVAYQGKGSQYKVFVSDFLQPLYEIVGKEKQSNTFVVPGNHDVFRKTHKFLDREATCKQKDSHFFEPTKAGKEERQQVLPRFKAYAKNTYLAPHNWINTLEGSYAKRVPIGKTTLGVVGINTAWLSLDDNDRLQLTPGSNLLKDALEKLQNCNIKIVLGHHPIEWFRPDQVKTIKSILRKHNALYLHGHRHDTYADPIGGEYLCVQCGAAFQTRGYDKCNNVNGLMWAKLDLTQRFLYLQPRQWNSEDTSGWPLGIGLPEDRRENDKDWWKLPLPGEAPPQQQILGPSELHDQIQPMYQEQVGFTGRNQEIQEFKQFLKSDDIVLNFHGISGIGKSWLLNQLLKDLSIGRVVKDYRAARIDCKEIDGNLFKFMRLIAHYIGEKRLPHYTSKRNTYLENSLPVPLLHLQSVYEMWDLLFLDLQIISKTELLIIFIDSFERVQETIIGSKLRVAFKDYFGDRSKSGLKVVIGSKAPIKTS